MRPSPLFAGDPIAVVAPSGPVSRPRLDAGIEVLRGWGHRVDRGPSILMRRGFLAGPDGKRAADLNAAIGREDAPAIFFARGGWGAARLLDRIDLDRLRARPRVLLGYSDLTAIFMALQRRGRPYPYRYGPHVSELGDPGTFDPRSLREALCLSTDPILHALRGCRILRPGRAKGTLIGGCLSLLTLLLGTRYDFPWDGCLLFWEDLNEPPYRIDRMLHHLRLAGKLERLAGMIVGRLPGCEPKPPTPGRPIGDLILEATAGTRYPIVMNFPAGHIPRKRTLLMGVQAEMETGERRLSLMTVR